MLFKQPDHGEGGPGGDQGGAFLADVAAVLDGLDDGGVGGRPADAAFFEFADERCFGVVRRRGGGVFLGLDQLRVERVTLAQRRQDPLFFGHIALGFVGALHVGRKKPSKLMTLPKAEKVAWPCSPAGATNHGGARADCVLHLAGQSVLPDEVVKAEFVAAQLALQFPGGAEGVPAGRMASWASWMPLALGGVVRGASGTHPPAVEIGGLGTGGIDRLGGQLSRIGTHVGDVAVLVQRLGHVHGVLHAEAELASGLLLETRGDERRLRALGERFLVHALDGKRHGAEQAGQGGREGLIYQADAVGAC